MRKLILSLQNLMIFFMEFDGFQLFLFIYFRNIYVFRNFKKIYPNFMNIYAF